MDRRIDIVGVGVGDPSLMTGAAQEAAASCDCLIGAQRMVDCFPRCSAERFISVSNDAIFDYIQAHPQYRHVVVAVSGDVGFYSVSLRLTQKLREGGFTNVNRICGISSVVYFCSKLETPWQDVKLVSLHGRDSRFLGAILTNRKTFMLTGGDHRVHTICRKLTDWGLGHLTVSAGSNLSYPNERIVTDRADVLAEQEFDSLSVMLVQNENPLNLNATHGIPDEAFLRGEAPMTKEEVRAVSLAKLRLRSGDIVYDVGAGTGSVTVEMALRAVDGFVYGIEKNPKALELLEENRRRFGAYNIEIVSAVAPAGMEDLPAPDKVFIGGSSGNMNAIFETVLKKNPRARIVVNAITLETVSEALDCYRRFGMTDVDIVQMSVGKSKKVGSYHMMMGQNPVYIFSGEGAGTEEE